MSSEVEQRFSTYGGLVKLWAAWIIAPIAWALHMQVSYLLVPWVCTTGMRFALHLTTILALLAAATGGFIAWRCWREIHHHDTNAASVVLRRTRFLAVVGLLVSSLFFVVIAVQGLPNFFLDACQ